MSKKKKIVTVAQARKIARGIQERADERRRVSDKASVLEYQKFLAKDEQDWSEALSQHESVLADDGTPYATILVEGDGNPANTYVRLSTGHCLGLVQSVSYQARVGEVSRCTVETILNPADLKALMEDTTVKVVLFEHPVKTLWVYYIGRIKRLWRRASPTRKPRGLDMSDIIRELEKDPPQTSKPS